MKVYETHYEMKRVDKVTFVVCDICNSLAGGDAIDIHTLCRDVEGVKYDVCAKCWREVLEPLLGISKICKIAEVGINLPKL